MVNKIKKIKKEEIEKGFIFYLSRSIREYRPRPLFKPTFQPPSTVATPRDNYDDGIHYGWVLVRWVLVWVLYYNIYLYSYVYIFTSICIRTYIGRSDYARMQPPTVYTMTTRRRRRFPPHVNWGGKTTGVEIYVHVQNYILWVWVTMYVF